MKCTSQRIQVPNIIDWAGSQAKEDISTSVCQGGRCFQCQDDVVAAGRAHFHSCNVVCAGERSKPTARTSAAQACVLRAPTPVLEASLMTRSEVICRCLSHGYARLDIVCASFF